MLTSFIVSSILDGQKSRINMDCGTGKGTNSLHVVQQEEIKSFSKRRRKRRSFIEFIFLLPLILVCMSLLVVVQSRERLSLARTTAAY